MSVLEVVVLDEPLGERQVLVLGQPSLYDVYLALHVELVVAVVPVGEHPVLRQQQCLACLGHGLERSREVGISVGLVLVGMREIVQRGAEMGHVVRVGGQIVVEEGAAVLGQLLHERVAAPCHVGEGGHLAGRAGYDAVYLAAALYAERASGHALVAYLAEGVGVVGAPLVVYHLDGPLMTQVLKHVLAVEASGEIALLLVPVGVVEVVVELRYCGRMLLTEVLCAVRQEELVGVVRAGVPHHGGVGRHLHEELTHVAGVDHAEREGPLRLHVSVVGLHLPRPLGRREVRSCGVELQVHVVAELHVVGVGPPHDVVAWVVVAPPRHESPQHVGGGRRHEVALGHER